MARILDGTGRTVDEYIGELIIEARTDAVAIGLIKSWGKRQFELNEDEIEPFMRKVITALLQQGVKVVRAIDVSLGYGWKLRPEYQLPTVEATVDKLMEDSIRFADDEFFAWFTYDVTH